MKGIFYVIILFLIFIIQWETKRRIQITRSGIDPEVFKEARSPIQTFMHKMNIILTIYIVILIICHGLEVSYHNLFSMYTPLDIPLFDYLGFTMGLGGLGIALYAQIKMGNNWRVGIDEHEDTNLITDGLYRLIRNPTYFGIFFLIAGLWIIIPSWTMFLFCSMFYLFIEIQVRCEEEFLLKQHGEKYETYMEKTKRYIPFIY